jgi:hypothetical protein
MSAYWIKGLEESKGLVHLVERPEVEGAFSGVNMSGQPRRLSLIDRWRIPWENLDEETAGLEGDSHKRTMKMKPTMAPVFSQRDL